MASYRDWKKSLEIRDTEAALILKRVFQDAESDPLKMSIEETISMYVVVSVYGVTSVFENINREYHAHRSLHTARQSLTDCDENSKHQRSNTGTSPTHTVQSILETESR